MARFSSAARRPAVTAPAVLRYRGPLRTCGSLRPAEPAQFGAFREPMATVASPDEAENLVEDDTGDRGRKDHDDERRTVVGCEHLNRRVVGVLRGQDDGQYRHCNANNESDADTGSASIDVAGGCTFVGAPWFGRWAEAVAHNVPFDVVSHARDDSSAQLPSQAAAEAPPASHT